MPDDDWEPDEDKRKCGFCGLWVDHDEMTKTPTYGLVCWDHLADSHR